MEELSPTIQKLRSLPKPSYHKAAWPPGKRQPLTRPLAERFFELLSTCDTSLMDLLHAHPELPPFAQLHSWRCHNKSGFGDQWKVAMQNRAQFLAERCAGLARTATPQTAHLARVQFDIFRWLTSKFHPAAYAEKPATAPIQTVNVGVAISPQRLQELRSKLEQTRSAFSNPSASASRLNRP